MTPGHVSQLRQDGLAPPLLFGSAILIRDFRAD